MSGNRDELPYQETGERCPKCGERMIINRRYEECSAMHCDYIKKELCPACTGAGNIHRNCILRKT